MSEVVHEYILIAWRLYFTNEYKQKNVSFQKSTLQFVSSTKTFKSGLYFLSYLLLEGYNVCKYHICKIVCEIYFYLNYILKFGFSDINIFLDIQILNGSARSSYHS